MADRAIKITKLRCNDTDDDDVDELFMFHNGSRFWPPSGTFGITQGAELPFDVIFTFGSAEGKRISLRDDESPLGSDSLGFVDISRFEPNGEHQKHFDGGDGGDYTLTYRIGDLDI